MKAIREVLLQCYLSGVARVRGHDAVRAYLTQHPPTRPLNLVAIGKAAADMTLGAVASCDNFIRDGLVITKHNHLLPDLVRDNRFECIESDHPLPGEDTLRAGAALLNYLETRARSGTHFLFLLSGGASSLVESLPNGMSLDELRKLNQTLLADGLDIGRMNRMRCALSRIKSGRLAIYLKGCPTLNLLISDVPGDNPAVIGSGLLTYSADPIDRSVYSQSACEIFDRYHCAPVTDVQYFSNVNTHIIACLDDAKKAAAAKAKTRSFPVKVVSQFLAGDAAEAGAELARTLCNNPGQLFVWGGETTVTLPEHPGCGGRNQHLALSAAIALQGMEGVYLLAAGTDGTDGPTSAAGGLVDSGTVWRGRDAGLDAEDHLRSADAGTFLNATNDLIETGPTGTNVMDLVLGFNAGAAR